MAWPHWKCEYDKGFSLKLTLVCELANLSATQLDGYQLRNNHMLRITLYFRFSGLSKFFHAKEFHDILVELLPLAPNP